MNELFLLDLFGMIWYFWASVSLIFSGMFWTFCEYGLKCFSKLLTVLEVV